jgi:glycosyltransferase involved in cell wall biosynthesis
MKPRLLVVNPSLHPPGGGNAVAAWGVQALLRDFRITLDLWTPPDFERINRYYGTSLQAALFERVRVAPASLRAVWRRSPVPLAALLRAVQSHRAKKLAGDFDVVITFNNEIDVGRRAMQYMHFPWRYWPRPDADIRWYHRIPGVLRLYYAITGRGFGFSRERAARNLTLVNSDWTGGKYSEAYGATSTTLYPPVFPSQQARPWSERENVFLALGRISPEKNLEAAIRILEQVRRLGHDVRLLIAGSPGRDTYVAKIRALVQEHPDWASMATDLPRSEIESLLGRTRYGIHSMIDEHFGIAVAEMAMSGMIPFIHQSGGATEILRDPRLTWSSVDDAAQKIVAVLADRVEQDRLRQQLAAQTRIFSYEHFANRLCGLAGTMAKESESATIATP